MKWIEDKQLTEKQQTLKWYIYLELDMEEDEDTRAVLKSLLKDL